MIDPEGHSLVTKPFHTCLTTVCIAIGLVVLGILTGYFLFRK